VKANNVKASKNYKPLNSTWKFNWTRTPEDRPVDFHKEDYNTNDWDDTGYKVFLLSSHLAAYIISAIG